MILGVGRDQAPGALMAMVAVMVDPRLSEHLPAKALRHFFTSLLPAVVRVGLPFGHVEGMGRRPQTDHRLAGPEIVVDLLHLLVGQVAEPGGDHHQVGHTQRLEAGNVGGGVGADLTRRWIDRIEHGAGETVVPGENLRQLRERLLAAVFLVAADKHDLLPLPRPLAPLDHDPLIGGKGGSNREQGQKGGLKPVMEAHAGNS